MMKYAKCLVTHIIPNIVHCTNIFGYNAATQPFTVLLISHLLQQDNCNSKLIQFPFKFILIELMSTYLFVIKQIF